MLGRSGQRNPTAAAAAAGENAVSAPASFTFSVFETLPFLCIKMDDGVASATSSTMESKFPDCKELLVAYQTCFKNKKWTWGQVDEDECEETFEKMRECMEESKRKLAR